MGLGLGLGLGQGFAHGTLGTRELTQRGERAFVPWLGLGLGLGLGMGLGLGLG